MDPPIWSALHKELENSAGKIRLAQIARWKPVAYATQTRIGKIACATVYFQHLVTIEYFRERGGFAQR
jgi:hypothetical protein